MENILKEILAELKEINRKLEPRLINFDVVLDELKKDAERLSASNRPKKPWG